MIDANAIRNNIETEFKLKFDFAKFDEFINNAFITKKCTSVNIGLEYDNHFEKFHSSTGLVTFIKGHDNFYWASNCQMPQRIVPCVEKYLHDAGFKTTKRGVAGFNDYDIIEVKL